MRKTAENIWENGEYTYEAAYGFVPNIHSYIHDDDEARDCMIIVPGGGYCMVVPPEATIPAMEFYNRGMNVFILTYTTDITFAVPLKKQPMNDLARAIRFIRKRAAEYKIEGKRLFVCGFSAGAHVCGCVAVHHKEIEDADPEYKDISCRPDGAILSYPVITMGEYTHIFSVNALLGVNAPEEDKNYFSLEKNVDEDTSPCFIWQTATDDLVPVENSYLMAKALKEKGVFFAHYVFPEGFHGLSVPNEDFFAGKFEEFTMDQVFRAVKAVKEGKGVNVPDHRVKELKEQFPDEKPEPSEADMQNSPFAGRDPLKDFADVRTWPDLAVQWMNKIK